MSKYRIDTCPECKVRESDGSRKRLYQCKYCERWFCKRHIEPAIAFLPQLGGFIVKPPTWEDRAWKVFFEKEMRKYPNCHPDFDYTIRRWEEIKLEKQEELRKIIAFIESTYIKPEDYQLMDEKEIIEGYCPKCGSDRVQTSAYRPEGIYYECLDCGHKLLAGEKKQPERKIAPVIATIVIAIFVIIMILLILTESFPFI